MAKHWKNKYYFI